MLTGGRVIFASENPHGLVARLEALPIEPDAFVAQSADFEHVDHSIGRGRSRSVLVLDMATVVGSVHVSVGWNRSAPSVAIRYQQQV